MKNERRQSVDNQPYGRSDEILSRATYPASHPYSWDVIGSMEDLSAASEEDVKNFFRLYYAPNNAYLSIVGDFDAAQAKAWVTKYFGGIPRGKPITRPTVAPVTLNAETRLVYEDRVQVPRLYVQWPTVGMKSDDRFALGVLGTILTGARTARITKALVYDEQAAASATAFQSTNEDVGEFRLTLTPRPGHTLTALEAAADAIIERLKKEGPTAEEMQKAIAGEELDFISNLESNLGKALRLHGRRRIRGRRRVLPDRVPEDALGDRRRRHTCRQQVPDRPRRVEHRAGGRVESGGEARSEQARDRLRRQEAGRCQVNAWLTMAALALLTVAPASQEPAFDRKKVPVPGQDAGTPRAGVDEEHAGQRRGPDRRGEARSAAHLVLDHVPRRCGSVRAGRQAGGRLADGGAAQRRHEDA